MIRGKFITFEGNEGCGKTTITTKVYNQLKSEGIDVILTREPGGIEIAEQIRKIILDPSNDKMDARSEALLYAAARRQHLVEKVIPALKAGKVVLCDRFIDSSLAYQGYARGLGMEAILHVNEFAIEGNMPNLTILLQVEIEEGLNRIKQRQEALNRLDQESITFHQKVAEGYILVQAMYPKRIHVVDANQAVDQVYEDTLALVRQAIKHE